MYLAGMSGRIAGLCGKTYGHTEGMKKCAIRAIVVDGYLEDIARDAEALQICCS